MTTAQDVIVAVLEKKKPFTRQELQALRENTAGTGYLSSRSDPFIFRIEIELIDAITALNMATTRLMWVAIGVAVVGVIVSATQIVAAVLLRR